MPDGATHYELYKRGALVALPACAVITHMADPLLGAGAMVGYLLGRWIDPDLDQPGLTMAEGRMFRELKFFGALFAAYWLPYGYLCRRSHRTVWTHFPGISTAIRFLWLFPLLACLGLFLGIGLDRSSARVLVGIWIGLSMADTWHFIADLGTGEIRWPKSIKKLLR